MGLGKETKLTVKVTQALANQVIRLAQKAGEKILEIYSRDFEVTEKSDQSPLTEADLLSHKTIVDGLKLITPTIPVLSEESSERDITDRMDWETYWLIDPLDGTKEFVKKNGEFTVNIALVHDNQPVLGVVYAPVLKTTYWGGVELGAHKITQNEQVAISVRDRPKSSSEWKIVGSRSHQSDEFKSFIGKYPGAEIISMGSSLKLCLVAEGAADLYPRLGLTSEWDTAAAQAVVEAAGGQVLKIPEMTPLRCNEDESSLLNPYFLVCGDAL